jgi:Spy/CpxP family protein refolding chaperone
MNTSTSTQSSSAAARHTQRWALGTLIAATTASVVLSLSAWAGVDEAPNRGAPPLPHAAMGHGGPDAFGGLPFDGRRLQHLLDDAKVSDAQRTQIQQIADKAQADLKSLFEEGRTLQEQGLAIWSAPRIDANAAEALRQKMLAHHDKVSKRTMQAVLDVGNVLTPEQRVTVATQIKKHHEDMLHRIQNHDGRRVGPGPGATGQQPGGQ